MNALNATSLIGMAVATIVLGGITFWAQSFRRQPRNIIGSRNIFLMGSGLLILVCVIGMIYRGVTTGFNLGMDFTGGTVLEVGFYDNTDALTTQKIADAVVQADPALRSPEVQLEEQVFSARPNPAASDSSAPASASPSAAPSSSPASQGYRSSLGSVPVDLEASPTASASAASASPAAVSGSPAAAASSAPTGTDTPAATPEMKAVNAPYKPAIIRLSKTDFRPLTSAEINDLLAKLQPILGRTTAPLSIESVSPVIGSELFKSGLLALLIALGVQLIYITFRFGNQWSFGIAADVALVHDIIIMVGFYVLCNRQIDSPFLAALLTVIGYSVMDSIVIFDRIRENVKNNRKADFEEVVNKSVNETMTRSINTLMTVLICLFSLYFLGEATLRNFAFALLVGVTSGGYSSIFIASPILVMWDKWARGREADALATRRASLARQPAGGRSAEGTGEKDEDDEGTVPVVGNVDRSRRARAAARRRR